MFDFLSKKLSTLFSGFSGSKAISEDAVNEFLSHMRNVLIEADVPYDVVQAFIEEIRQSVEGKKLEAGLKPDEFMMKTVHDRLLLFLGGKADDAAFRFKFPAIIMMMGLQGSGKTTTIGKLAHFIKEGAPKAKILAASVDFYRPAAIEQLEIVSRGVNIDFYRAQSTDPVQAAREIESYRVQHKYDILLLDTAGRLHIDSVLLEELREVISVVRPNYTLLVLDSMTGQESLKIAQAFDQVVSFTAAVLTKMDSDTRGGIAFSFRYVMKKPILFVGAGEKSADFEPFRPERMVQRMIGMGDMLTLVEQAEKKIKKNEQEQFEKTFTKDQLTLEDFAHHLAFMRNLGPLSKIMSYVPGAMQQKLSPEQLAEGERTMKQFEAIMFSMTRKEKLMPKILDQSRKERIAKGAGVSVRDINLMLDRFYQSSQMLKNLKRMGLFK